jgi:hypothetical protein
LEWSAAAAVRAEGTKLVKIGAGRVKKSTRSPTRRSGTVTTPLVVDVLFILITVAFFAICVAYVRWCDRIIGVDEWTSEHADGAPPGAIGLAPEEVAA